MLQPCLHPVMDIPATAPELPQFARVCGKLRPGKLRPSGKMNEMNAHLQITI